MSRENVEVAERGMDAVNVRDVDALTEVITSDFVWFPAMPGSIEGDGHKGRQGVETYFNEIIQTWEAYRLFVDEFRDLGDRVLALGRIEVRGRGSGVPMRAALDVMFDFRGNRCSRARGYLDHDEAMRAAGLAV